MIENKFAVMKFISRHKLLFICLIFAWILGMIVTVMLIGRNTHTRMKVQQMMSHPLIHPMQHNRLPPASSFKMVKALRYCNPPNEITYSQEGKAPENSTLELIALVIRHGDRAPLRPVRNQSLISCGTQNTPLLLKYLKTMKYLRGSSKHLSPFTTFPLQPVEKRCISAQMTLLGAHQLLVLGHVLQKAYVHDHGLLDKNWTSSHIRLFSTIYSRTFQSAVAFLFGFLPSFNISNIKIIPSPDTRFCMSEYYCKCNLLQSLQPLMEKKMKRLLNSHPAVVHLLQRLNPIVKSNPNHTDLSAPLAMFDSLMGYVCHGSHLPCIPGTNKCVTFEHVRNLIAYLDWEGRQFVTDSTHTKTAKLKMLGFLVHLVSHMKNFTSGRESARFLLFSGHDVTVEPLSTALGIDDGSMIPYASRISFELYNQFLNNKPKYLIKVIYNGKDVTKYTSFCKHYFKNSFKRHEQMLEFGVCPFETFRKFVEEDYVLTMGASSFSSACDPLHTTSGPLDMKHSSYNFKNSKI